MDKLIARAKKILEKLNPDEKRREARGLEAEMAAPGFWQDSKLAAEKTRRLAELQEEIKKLEALEGWTEGRGDTDEIREIEHIVDELETRLYLSGPYDNEGAMVAIHAGQGGVEAMDWTEMLYRMYLHLIGRRGWKTTEVDYEPGQEAGIKTVTFSVEGGRAYGYLKYEAGVHRLVRLSPFNADHLRQTSFALVEVMPATEDKGKGVFIKDEDLEWEFFRSSGHGGQNVNKVSSAVRLKHKPTGIVVSSQKERDQSKNRQIAVKILMAKLLGREEEKERQEEMRLKGKHVTPGWGNQIRSYVLHPYHLVKDLRTDYEETDTAAVLNGELDKFIEAELHFFGGHSTQRVAYSM